MFGPLNSKTRKLWMIDMNCRELVVFNKLVMCNLFIFVGREIDREEFKKVMALMRSQNRQGAQHRDGRRLGAKVSVENGGLVEYFFGKDGKNCLQIESFVQFLSDLHNEVCNSFYLPNLCICSCVFNFLSWETVIS